MMLVIDNNVLFALMKPDSSASKIFHSLNKKLLAPEHIKKEFKKHEKECMLKSNLGKQEFEKRLTEVEARVIFYGPLEYSRSFNDALAVVDDPDDAHYLALALSLGASIWSNDAHFRKQRLVGVYTTRDMVELVLGGE